VKTLQTKIISGVCATLFSLALLPASADAQALSPMRGVVSSFTDTFAVKVFPANPYTHRIRIEIRVYDQDFNPVKARVSPANFTLGGNTSRPVTVLIPFDGASARKVRVCAESVPFPGKTSNIKAQICGKFLGQRAQ
jgi:hypothetical protein